MIDPIFSLLFLAAIGVPIGAILWLARRRRTGRSKALAVACIVSSIAPFLFYAGPVLFVTNDGMVTVYVLTPQSKANQFTDDLAAIARRHGLSPNLRQVTDDRRHTTYILQATGHWLSLWATNLPVGPNDSPAVCGHHTEGYQDPGQYIVTLSRILPLGTTRAAQALVSSMGQELKAEGYEMRPTPIVCSPLAKLMPNP